MSASLANSNKPRMCREPMARVKRDEAEPLMTSQEVADYLRIHPKTVIRLARQAELPALRFGKHWRFRLSDLLDWTDSRLQSNRQPVE